MKNFISFLIFILFALLGMWWYYSCPLCLGDRNKGPSIIKEKMNPEAEARAKKAFEDSLALAHGLFAKDDQNNDVFRYPENLQINNKNLDVQIPNGIVGFGTEVANYLGTHQDQEIIIYGYETSRERERDTLSGISRANFIKNFLVNAGINKDRIVSKAKLQNYDYNSDGYYKGGILLDFHKINSARLKEIEKGVANKILYSGFGSKSFKPDATLANYALELKAYLNKYPDKNVVIIGHTDNIGSDKDNQVFGAKRANNVKKYLISKGIPDDKLTAASKGESNPIASNDTEENRAKNRRIEIIVN